MSNSTASAKLLPNGLATLLGHKLSTKIIGILVAFFLSALAAIAVTLFISWRLEGVAAAINDAGSLRMRSWKIAHDLTTLAAAGPARQSALAALQDDMAVFERVQSGLERGDPARPLFLPRDNNIPADVARIGATWRDRLKPLLQRLAAVTEPDTLAEDGARFVAEMSFSVVTINQVVQKMEASYARNTNVLRASQVMLICMAVIGTVLLIRFFFVAVIRPVHELQVGVRRMELEDFGVRVPVLTNDELGELSQGFNRMAGHLQNLYATLEERVEAKTKSLAETNRELGILYDISRFLRQPAGIEELSRGFLDRVKTTFQADAASVRLYEARSGNLYLTTHDGLNSQFVDREAVLRCGECLCGESMAGDTPVVSQLGGQVAGMLRVNRLGYCRQAGFDTVCAVPINQNGRPVGLFNLYFSRATELSAGDRQVLESLGQHLGVAIEHVRLQAREREMAVSEERNMMARELHDSIAQGLAFLNLQAQMLASAMRDGKQEEAEEAVHQIRQGIQESYADVRELLQHFRARLDQPDLDSAIRAALVKFSAQTSVETEFVPYGDGASFETESETQILYIVQEALSNIRKHAGASHVRVELWRRPEGLRLTVSDDGVGFDPAAGTENGAVDHVGLNIMAERAAKIGGRVEVDTRPGGGTCVALSLMRTGRETA